MNDDRTDTACHLQRRQATNPAKPGRRTKLFQHGRLVATQGALALLKVADETAIPYLRRHLRGEWGAVTVDAAWANDVSLSFGGCLLSVYEVCGQRLWVLTEADRSVTTVLLPSEH